MAKPDLLALPKEQLAHALERWVEWAKSATGHGGDDHWTASDSTCLRKLLNERLVGCEVVVKWPAPPLPPSPPLRDPRIGSKIVWRDVPIGYVVDDNFFTDKSLRVSTKIGIRVETGRGSIGWSAGDQDALVTVRAIIDANLCHAAGRRADATGALNLARAAALVALAATP